MAKICSFAGCDSLSLARGYCKRHYDRWHRHGDPSICLKPMVKRGEPWRWLQEHASFAGDECLIWPFARHVSGRAHMKRGKPSRIMCELVHGPVPTSTHHAAHSCGKANNGCVNPRHLRWATPAENAADKEQHGTVSRGVKYYAAKFTNDDIRRIRFLAGKVRGRDLAAEYGVSVSNISAVQTGKSWRGVPI